MAVKIITNTIDEEEINLSSIVVAKHSDGTQYMLVRDVAYREYRLVDLAKGIVCGQGNDNDLKQFIEKYGLRLVTNDIEFVLNKARQYKDDDE